MPGEKEARKNNKNRSRVAERKGSGGTVIQAARNKRNSDGLGEERAG